VYPLVVKPNIGGSGAGIARFDTREELETAVERDLIEPSLDSVWLLQEFHPPRGDSIVRVETLAGRVLYAIRVHLGAGSGFNLCPAELCTTTSGQRLKSEACPAGAETAGVTIEAWDPPTEVKREAEVLARAAGLDVGGIEYLESTREGGARVYYDINALSNFVPDAPRVVGVDATSRFVDYVLGRAIVRRPARGETSRRRTAVAAA
jgi:hypothetical protein